MQYFLPIYLPMYGIASSVINGDARKIPHEAHRIDLSPIRLEQMRLMVTDTNMTSGFSAAGRTRDVVIQFAGSCRGRGWRAGTDYTSSPLARANSLNCISMSGFDSISLLRSLLVIL